MTSPDGVPSAAELADEWDTAILTLASALHEQIVEAARAAIQREVMARLEADCTISPRVDGKNEASRRAQVVLLLGELPAYDAAVAHAEEAERLAALAGARAEVERERCRRARSLLALLTAQAGAGELSERA